MFLNIMLHQIVIFKYPQNSIYVILFMNLCFPKERVNTRNTSSSNSLIYFGEFLNTVQVKCSS